MMNETQQSRVHDFGGRRAVPDPSRRRCASMSAKGLLKPSRSDGNTRLYTDDDLERLEVILKLTRDLGVNLAGVEIILNMREKMAEMQHQIEAVRGEPEYRDQPARAAGCRMSRELADPGDRDPAAEEAVTFTAGHRVWHHRKCADASVHRAQDWLRAQRPSLDRLCNALKDRPHGLLQRSSIAEVQGRLGLRQSLRRRIARALLGFGGEKERRGSSSVWIGQGPHRGRCCPRVLRNRRRGRTGRVAA